MGAMASQTTSLMIIYSTVYSGADQRKHQSPASLAFVRGIHRWPVNSPHKGPVTRKMVPFDEVIMKPLKSGTHFTKISHIQFNTLKPRQNGRHFADDTFKCIFLNENVWIPITIWLEFVPKGPINNIPALVQIMAWHRPGDKPLSESMMVSLQTHICVTQWVNSLGLVTPFWFPSMLDRAMTCHLFRWHFHMYSFKFDRGSLLRIHPVNTLRPRQWTPFRKRHFQMHYLEWKYMNF